LGVAATYTVGARVFGRTEGLVGALLLALATLHVRYSQDARFYTLLVLLALLSLYCLHRAIRQGKRAWWAGFALCTVLNLYNHHFSFFVLLAEAAYVGGLWLYTERSVLLRRRGAGGAMSVPNPRGACVDRDVARWFLASLGAITLAYVPMMPHLWRGIVGSKGLGAPATGGVSLTSSLAFEQLDAWGVGSGWGTLLLAVPFAIGLVALARTQRPQLWLAVCWLVVPFVAVSILPGHHRFRPRYVLFMLPLYLLVVARGLTFLGRLAESGTRGSRIRARELVIVGFLLLMVPFSALSLQAYYEEDRANWRAAAELLESMVQPTDLIVSPGAFAQVALPRYSERLSGAQFVIGGSEVFLSSDRDSEVGMWYVGLQEGRMSDIDSELGAVISPHFTALIKIDEAKVARGRSLKIAPVMYRDVWVLYVREDLGIGELITLYETALAVLPEGSRPSVHLAVADLYRGMSFYDQAVEHYEAVALLDPLAPEPHYGLAMVYEAQGLMDACEREWQIYEELSAPDD
jgi:tetratricopeptide (TPR) repeat protein